MGVSLAEALEQVKLEPGQTYRCRVKEHWVELRVLPATELPPPSPVDVEDIMLDPWTSFPPPSGGVLVRGTPGPLPPPVIPVIPVDEEDT